MAASILRHDFIVFEHGMGVFSIEVAFKGDVQAVVLVDCVQPADHRDHWISRQFEPYAVIPTELTIQRISTTYTDCSFSGSQHRIAVHIEKLLILFSSHQFPIP